MVLEATPAAFKLRRFKAVGAAYATHMSTHAPVATIATNMCSALHHAPANETCALLIFGDVVSVIARGAESVNDDTRNDAQHDDGNQDKEQDIKQLAGTRHSIELHACT